MALTAAHTWFWAHVLLLCATSVTSMRINFNIEAPKTFWVDKTCIQKGFSPTTAQESIDIALLSAHRLVNLNDDYQAFIYNLLFKAVRDFGLEDDSWTETWNVVEVEGWIGAMKYETNRDTADVRIFCDNDARWTRVPDDPISIARGMLANSLRTFGDDAEYEDLTNSMRRATEMQGCQDPNTLGVTYETMSPSSDHRVPSNVHSPRQTITICDLAFRSRIKKFGDISLRDWRFIRMGAVNIIPSSILLYQLLGLEPYHVRQSVDQSFDRRITWTYMLSMTQEQLAQTPAPYMWNAILSYAASLGWGVQQGLSAEQYSQGQDLLRYQTALKRPLFVRAIPANLPDWMQLPPIVFEPM